MDDYGRYSPAMQAQVAQWLQNVSDKDLTGLRKHFDQRGGDGLKLVTAEQQRRLTETQSTNAN